MWVLEQVQKVTTMDLLDYAKLLGILVPYGILGYAFRYVIGSIKERVIQLESNKVDGKVFDVVQRELKDSMDEVKYTNAEIQNEQKKQRELLIEISTDLKWIKKNGGKS